MKILKRIIQRIQEYRGRKKLLNQMKRDAQEKYKDNYYYYYSSAKAKCSSNDDINILNYMLVYDMIDTMTSSSSSSSSYDSRDSDYNYKSSSSSSED